MGGQKRRFRYSSGVHQSWAILLWLQPLQGGSMLGRTSDRPISFTDRRTAMKRWSCRPSWEIRSFSSGTPNSKNFRPFSSFAFLLALIPSPLLVVSCDGSGGGTGDKPAGNSSEEKKSSMEKPRQVITFYSQRYESDGFFYAIDRSEKMQDSGELERAKTEMINNIKEFRPDVEFGIVFFDRGIKKFPSAGRPTLANDAMKAAAINWIQSVPGGTGSCCQQGLIEAQKYAMVARTSRHRTVMFVGNAGVDCQGADEESYLDQTLEFIKSQKSQRQQFNVIGVGEIGTTQENFLKSLASMNGGTYVKSI